MSCRRAPRRADAGGIDYEADERVLLPASCPPWRARNPARGEINIWADERRRALPAGLTARPTHERDLLLLLRRLAPSPHPCQKTCRVAAVAWEEVASEGDFAACAWLSRQHEAAH